MFQIFVAVAEVHDAVVVVVVVVVVVEVFEAVVAVVRFDSIIYCTYIVTINGLE